MSNSIIATKGLEEVRDYKDAKVKHFAKLWDLPSPH